MSPWMKTTDTVIDLSQVFSDADSNTITKAVVDNTNATMVSASVNGNT